MDVKIGCKSRSGDKAPVRKKFLTDNLYKEKKMATTSDKIIEIKNVCKSYDDKPVVKNLSLTIKRGEFVTLLGPSGCGKTTTLRMIAGFEQPTSGTILFNGQDITQLPPHKRNINTVFQKYALFPHLNVFGNIAFGLKLKTVPDNEPYVDKKGNTVQKMRNLTKAEIAEKVNNALKMVDLEDYGHRQPRSSCCLPRRRSWSAVCGAVVPRRKKASGSVLPRPSRNWPSRITLPSSWSTTRSAPVPKSCTRSSASVQD